jgi:hypothetical protein
MKFRNIFFLTIFINFIYYSKAVHSSDDEGEAVLIKKVIAPIDVEKCRATADAISGDMAQDYFESLDPEEEKQREEERQQQIDWFFRATPSSPVAESEEQKLVRLQKEEEQRELRKKRIAKLEEKFIQDERAIYKKALSMLFNHPAKQKEYKILVRDQNLWPSIAILEFTKDINSTPRGLDLLKLVENYSYYQCEGCFHDRDVELEASYRIFSYYLDEYNKRAEALPDPKQMERSVHDLLQLCHKHIPTHPMSGVDDPECTMCHISCAVQMQLLALNLWYVDNPKLIRNVVDLYSLQRLFTLGVRFLECTTYGVMPQYFDLGYLLKKKKFVGIKIPCPKAKGQYQHLWVHPYLPLQVRITEMGKLTVGLLKNNPLTEDKRLTPNSIHEDNELYKISIPGLSTDTPDFSSYVIPARHLDSYQKLWAQQLNNSIKNDLMATAHGDIKLYDMNFRGMEKHLCHDHSNVNEEPEKKSKKKK